MSTIEVRAVLFGALSLLAGYIIWSAAITLLVSMVGISAPPGVWFLLTLLGAAGPVASGYVGARLAHSHRLLHGVLAAVAGTAIVLFILSAFSGFPNVYGVLSPVIISAFLSLAGAVLALHWPTRVAP